MGRWTPLILMAGGVAILLGTLLGINFPMGGQQTANAPAGNNNPTGRRESSVLPANINVNSTATRNDPQPIAGSNSQPTQRNNSNNSQVSNNNGSSRNNGTVNRPTRVAQGNANTGTTGNFNSTTGSNNTNSSTTNNNQSSSSNNQSNSSNQSSSSNNSQGKSPIRALW